MSLCLSVAATFSRVLVERSCLSAGLHPRTCSSDHTQVMPVGPIDGDEMSAEVSFRNPLGRRDLGDFHANPNTSKEWYKHTSTVVPGYKYFGTQYSFEVSSVIRLPSLWMFQNLWVGGERTPYYAKHKTNLWIPGPGTMLKTTLATPRVSPATVLLRRDPPGLRDVRPQRLHFELQRQLGRDLR